jgi:uncharacterized protein YciI
MQEGAKRSDIRSFFAFRGRAHLQRRTMNYDVWDVETGNCISRFDAEAAVLAWVQALLDRFGRQYADSLLVSIEDQRGEDAGSWSGEELRSRIVATSSRKSTAADWGTSEPATVRLQMSTYVCQLKRTRPTFPEDATPEELDILADHWRRLQRLHAEGTVTYVGRCEDLAFAITVFSADSDESAHTLAFDDPCVRAGLMEAEVHPYRVLLPED